MAAVTAYQETVETQMYWNLLKNLSDAVKVQLVMKLNQSLRIHQDQPTDEDIAGQVAYFDMLKKLKTYKVYAKGWDGEDASPLTEKVISNFSKILDRLDKRFLVGLTIYPETNGTLLIECTKREAGISLGEEKFSYYEIVDDVVEGKDGLPFSVEAAVDVILKISR